MAKVAKKTEAIVETPEAKFHEVRLQFVEAILAQKQLTKTSDPKIEKAYVVCGNHLATMTGMAKDSGKFGAWIVKAERMMKNFEHNAEYIRQAKKAAKAEKAVKKVKKAKVEEKTSS